jgi:photosynthetic reaction center H subunit
MYGAQSNVDFALVAVWLFIGFFVALVFWLRREDRREGYPLEDDPSGRLLPAGGFFFHPDPKTFKLPFGRGSVSVPDNKRDSRPLAAKLTSRVPGSPLVPTGNPLIDGIGPASYAQRAKTPELTSHGEVRIVPMRVAGDFHVAKEDRDPRGFAVYGCDGHKAGTVSEIWVDRGEAMVRYLEVGLTGGGTVILPLTMALLKSGQKKVLVDAITAAQFADVPKLANPDQITLDEEERVTAYYGGGFLYATPSRSEPLI